MNLQCSTKLLLHECYISKIHVCQLPTTGFPLFYWQKNPRLFQDFPGPPWKIFQDLFGARECLNIKKKRHLLSTYNIQSVVHCRKCSMKQNVLHYCCLFSIWTIRKMHDFRGYFSRTLSFNFQDFPGPKWFSRTFQVLEFSRKKIQDFPGGVGTLVITCQVIG